jgi:MFS family permease
MSTSTPTRKQLNPWWFVVGAGLANAVGPVMVSATLGVFILPVAEDTGFSRSAVTLGFTVAAIGMVIGLNIVGRLLDKFAVRYIMVPCFLLFSIFTAAISITPVNEWAFVVPYFFLGFFGAGTMIPFQKVVMSWFDNKRALAVGVMGSILALGIALMPLVASALIAAMGWRLAYVGLAVIAAVVSLTMVLLFGRVRGERHVRGRLIQEAKVQGHEVSLEVPGLTFGEAIRTRHFWFIAIGLGLTGLVIVGIQINLVPLLIDRGFDPGVAALLLSVLGLTSMVGHVIGGYIVDRVRVTYVAAVVILIPIGGLLALNQPLALAVVAVGFIGLAFGLESDLLPFLLSRYLGMRSFGQLMGPIYSAFILAQAFGPLLFGIAFDTFGSYDPILPIFIGVLVVCAAMVFSLGKYRYPAITGFDRIAAKDELAAAEILAEVAEQEDAAPARAAGVPDAAGRA